MGRHIERHGPGHFMVNWSGFLCISSSPHCCQSGAPRFLAFSIIQKRSRSASYQPVYCLENHTVYASDIVPSFLLKRFCLIFAYVHIMIEQVDVKLKHHTQLSLPKSNWTNLNQVCSCCSCFCLAINFPHENAPQNKSTKGPMMALIEQTGHDMEEEHPDSVQGSVPTMWGPPSYVCWFVTPMNTIV